MTNRDLLVVTVALVVAFIVGWYCHHPAVETRVEQRVDTFWVNVHDTIIKSVETHVERLDTVLLARVDTLCTMDSVFVEVPISEQDWSGENWSITTEGYRVALKSVDFTVPTIEKTTTVTKTRVKHWNWGVGLQGGYGVTVHGMSPYAGVGVNFGYNF